MKSKLKLIKCTRCGKYARPEFIDIYTSNIKVCDNCYIKQGKESEICTDCGRQVLVWHGHHNAVNKFVCDVCWNRQKSVIITENDTRKTSQAKRIKAKRDEKIQYYVALFKAYLGESVRYFIMGIIGIILLAYFLLWLGAVIGNAIGGVDEFDLTAPFRK